MVEQVWGKRVLLLQFQVKKLEEKQVQQMVTLLLGFAGFTKYYTASVWLGFDVEADGNDSTNADSGMSRKII